MKLVIFAGGIGTRLWPLSRENSPKQFDKIFSGKSTIQLAVQRVAPTFGIENIYIQTIDKYQNIIREQIPKLPKDNIFIEPARRNLGPAVCYALLKLKNLGMTGPVALLWADHLMGRQEEFIEALRAGETLITEDANRFVFLAEHPRFANNNLGWIKVGERLGDIDSRSYFSFKGWKYKPGIEECVSMHRSGEYFWNPGYFITAIDFIIEQYKILAPDIYKDVAEGNYGEAEAIHFDRAIIEKVDLSNAVIVKTNMDWSDPGTLYALKEALAKSKEANVIQGKVIELDSSDCLFYNFDDKKLLAGVGLEGVVVVNTPDALIVVPKDEVVKVTQLVKKIKEEGLNEYL